MKTGKINCHILLRGGLGNQIWQYAFGRALSLRSNASLTIDTATLDIRGTRYPRHYELGAFRLNPEVKVLHRSNEIHLRIFRKIWKALFGTGPLESRRFLREPSIGNYDSGVDNLVLRRDCMLEGYWHCSKYITGIDRLLRGELTLERPLPSFYEHVAREISSVEAVGIHVRRVDFWSTLSIGYYMEAIRLLKVKFGMLRFYVFSDDPDWWRNNAGEEENMTVVSDRRARGIDDFNLLSRCCHFIISNSSFSWWAAWLGHCDEKVVVAPSKEIWFNSWEVLQDGWHIIPVEMDESSRQPGARSYNFVLKA